MIKDQRIDKMISWVLTLFCGLALSVGAWFFSGLQESVSKLTEAVGDLKTEVAVMRRDAEDVEEIKQELRLIKERLRALEVGGQ